VTLHSRIYFHSLAVLLVVVAATTLVFVFRPGGPPAREIAERVGRHVASLVAEDLADPHALEARVGQIHRDLGLDVVVRDTTGRQLAAAGAPIPRNAAEEERAVRQRGAVVAAHPDHHTIMAIEGAAGRPAAVVALRLQRRLRAPGLAAPLVLVGLVLGVVAIATRPLARRLSRPIERVTETARRLAAGDLSARVGQVRHAATRHDHRRGTDEIRTLTAAFDDMADRLERLVQGQKELLQNVSHELRSPLTRMRVALELLRRAPGDGPGTDDDAAARLADLERDLQDLDLLIEDVLAAARLDATGLPATVAPIALRTLLEALAERARHDPAAANRDVTVEAGPALTLLGDERLLRRALWNLVENAVKYGAPPITLAAGRRDRDVVISVRDAGPGIPADARERVLDPFYRLDTARSPDGAPRGFGLGLAFAKRVAEAHGGSIRVEAARHAGGAEHGCSVSLVLPGAQE
jgi:signal transduction histidine kinase